MPALNYSRPHIFAISASIFARLIRNSQAPPLPHCLLPDPSACHWHWACAPGWPPLLQFHRLAVGRVGAPRRAFASTALHSGSFRFASRPPLPLFGSPAGRIASHWPFYPPAPPLHFPLSHSATIHHSRRRLGPLRRHFRHADCHRFRCFAQFGSVIITNLFNYFIRHIPVASGRFAGLACRFIAALPSRRHLCNA